MNLRNFITGLASLAAAVTFSGSSALANDSYSGDVVAKEGAWCWFADPRAIHYENPQGTINASWLAYIDVHGNVKASQYDFLTGKRNEVLVRSYFQPDDHNNPTFLVLPDERVLIIYSRHTDEPAFYYRVSKRPGDITELGEEKKIVTQNNTTYPSPFILSDDPEHFYLCWRGIGWHPTIAKLSLPDENDDVNVEWGPFQMVQSTGARPYAKYYSNGKDKIYFTYTTGHPDNEMPNWLYCNVININAKSENGKVTTNPTLEDIKGTTLSTIANGKFNVSKTDDYKSRYPYTVVDATPGIRDWVWQIVLDKNGNPVIPMVKINDGKTSHEYNLARWNGSAWNVTPLVNAGGWFHSSNNTEKCYSGGEAIDPENTNVLYLSVPTEGDYGKVYEIWKYTVDDNGNVTDKTPVTKNSRKNNVRPYVLNNHGSSPITLGWMNGDYYYWMVNKNYPAGYPTAIHCDYDYKAEIGTDLGSPEFAETLNRQGAASDAVTVTLPDTFTLSVNLGLDPDAYSGTILSGDGFAYAVNAADQIPVLTLGNETYNSTNRLLSSDNWAANSTGTTSDYWPTKLECVNFTFSYDGKTLTVYRNGVIDQKTAAPGLKPGDVKIGGFKGTLGSVTLYNRCLNQDEINSAITLSALSAISIPETTDTDLVLPDKAGPAQISWTSDNPEILDNNGTFRSPSQETVVVLTADVDGTTRDFSVKALPRDIASNLLAYYTFETADGYDATDGKRMVRDLSGRDNDLALEGAAKAEGVLDLTANTSTGFQTNGYAVVPASVMDSLRSYTVMFRAVPAVVSGQPRFYDFGLNNGNSLFCRVSALSAGIKYQGGTTTMVNASKTLAANTQYDVAVTFDARTRTTTIYIDNTSVASGTANVNEPYMLAALGTCTRNYIGRTQWWDSSYANDNKDYIGTFDDFRIYNTCLSASEIAETFKTSAVSTVETDTIPSADLYDIHGTLVRKAATAADIDALAPGIYIHGDRKIIK